MATTRITNAAGGACATAIMDAIDAGSGAGTLKVYAGTMPANADTAITDQTLLGTLTLADPCGSVTNKTLTFGAITQDSAADATGTASFARIADSSGTTVMDVDITATGGGGTLTLNTVSIVAGGPIAVTSFSVTVG